jgi:hypothetical protein
VRRIGWFLVVVAAIAGGLAAVPRLKALLRPTEDEWEGLEPLPADDVVVVDDIEAEADVVQARTRKPRQARTDPKATELRDQIADSRARLRQKAKAPTQA